MAASGHFVRERIPVPNGVSQAARQVLEIVAGSQDTSAESVGPMTFKLVRHYRPNWATMTGFLIFPLFVRNHETCRLAVIQAPNGAELLLEGTIEQDLHDHLVQLSRVPEAARVSTLEPRPVPSSLSSQGPQPAFDQMINGAAGAAAANAGPFAPSRPASIDLRSRENGWEPERLPTLLPRDGENPAPNPNGDARVEHAGGSWAASPPRGPNGFLRPPSQPADTSVLGGDAAAFPINFAHVELTIDSGEHRQVPPRLIVGRAPTLSSSDEQGELLTVNDPSLSVSKSHLAVELDDEGLWITDLNSTNGSWIDEGRGALRPVPPNQRTMVPRGARVLIGERIITFIRN